MFVLVGKRQMIKRCARKIDVVRESLSFNLSIVSRSTAVNTILYALVSEY